MTQGTLKYKHAPYGSNIVLGRGAHSLVIRATEIYSGRLVALKKSRASRRLKRPTLRHEARLLQHLQGHPAIPAIYGYGHLEHFEYLAMELLGSSVEERRRDGMGVMAKTAIRVVSQALAALQHIHSLGIVHRDIKPGNFLCSLGDPSAIILVGFSISKPFSRGVSGRARYDPLKEHRYISGTLYWASLNSHNGEGQHLAPRDDIESLAITALDLLRGGLPWKPRPRLESTLRSQEVVRILKSICSGPDLSVKLPSEFGELLTYSRSLKYSDLPDYEMCRSSFANLTDRLGCSLDDGPLDWTPCDPPLTDLILKEPTVLIPDEDKIEAWGGGDEDSYFDWDIGDWERQEEREKEMTLPAELEVELDNTIPLIDQVYTDKAMLSH